MVRKKVYKQTSWTKIRKRLLSHFPYGVEDECIVLGKAKYSYRKLSVLAYVVRFLAFMLLAVSLCAYIVNGSLFNLISIIFAVLFFLYGCIYKMIVSQAKLDTYLDGCIRKNS
ncbi:MAG: hypothetical protein Q4C52_04720 [Eubacteriales bacterium]|nr:hypothetical protein [Eubacteriales bacterium]